MMEFVDAAARQRIEQALRAVEEREGVTILFAAESGSRAWGFPSPDSDYDVRFVYLRPLDWYLGLTRRRDVIEEMTDGDLDVAGWDVQKALRLMLGGNPALMEWLRSPIVYRERPEMAAVRALAARTRHRQAATHHYRSIARSLMDNTVVGRERVRLKKYLYCVRPAAALAWLRANPGGPVPMDLPAILDGVGLPAEVQAEVDRLLVQKAAISELGDGDRIAAIDAWVESEIAQAPAPEPETPTERAALTAAAEDLFRALVLGQGDHAASQHPSG